MYAGFIDVFSQNRSKLGADREVIPEFIFINNLGKQSCAGQGRMHTASETWSGGNKATEGLEGWQWHAPVLTLSKHRAAVFLPLLSPIISTPISCGAGEY